jgi:hypothetical protein
MFSAMGTEPRMRILQMRTLGSSRSCVNTRNQRAERTSLPRGFFHLERPINLFLSLPLWSIDHLVLKKEIDSIGRR